MQHKQMLVTRGVAIDPGLAAAVVERLDRGVAASALHWTLGNRGCASIESFEEADRCARNQPRSWVTTARLCDTSARELTRGWLELSEHGPDALELTLWAETDAPALRGLAQAFVDEMAEELLWHATPHRLAADRD